FKIVGNENPKGSSSQFKIDGLVNGATYYFAIRAIGENYEISEFSNTIMVIPARKEDIKRIIVNPVYDHSSATWSRDAGRLAFVTTRFRNEHLLHSVVHYSLSSGEYERLDVTTDALFPSWSPDAQRIAYNGGSSSDQSHIFIYEVDSDITNQVTKAEMINWDPDWSPDGRWLAYVSGNSGIDHQIFKISATGDEPIQLTHDAGSKFYPNWSPNGRVILYSKSVPLDDGTHARDIYMIPADGEAPTLILQLQWEDHYATWSPDGSQIAFVSNRSGHPEIWVLEIASNTLRQVTGTFLVSRVGSAEWSPVDNRILFTDLPDQNLYTVALD
ncbi:MAG: hypothetical protein GWN00_03280, partial [Aliifodinibius sp.]|nr:hypothetical protein [candidate division Zixibacteria bacterium]NIT55284.1 hypothetical protein [Fodinibius sp.]NIW43617.1 hypothetical protein [Gammaproteobacteria bacterium]NIS44724.1 hypothetical protein [candidate division Zixibacteria bacterium]NIU12821.1 hypothetical protein [candidate division Zixibacteria bacterium]